MTSNFRFLSRSTINAGIRFSAGTYITPFTTIGVASNAAHPAAASTGAIARYGILKPASACQRS
jgi:hypothetical protein